MPNDPFDPQTPTPPTRPYQTTPDSPGGGGGGAALIVILLLLIGGGGAAYYFLVYKPATSVAPVASVSTPSRTSATAPTPATPSPTPDTLANATYSNAQRGQYIKQAQDAFLTLRNVKTEPFTEAFSALNAAGDFSNAGLTSKEAIAARRELVRKCIAANEDLKEFYKTQEATFKAELQKTPLTPHDVDLTVDDFAYKAQTAKTVQTREIQSESLKTGDGILAYLDKTFGSWKIEASQRLVFTKKPADYNTLGELKKTYNDQLTAMAAVQQEIKAATDPNSTPPAASIAPASPVPAASATP